MNRVSAGNDILVKETDASIWEGDWLLVAARRGWNWAVVAMNPDGRRRRLRLPSLISSTVVAFRLVESRIVTGQQRKRADDRQPELGVGVAFGSRYGDPECVRVNPLKRVPSPDGVLYMYHSAKQDAGSLTVCTRSCYRQHPANRWCPAPIRRRIDEAFDAAGDTGFVVFNRETGALRIFDLKEEVVRVEMRPDGLVAAAFLKDNAVTFFDLGDD